MDDDIKLAAAVTRLAYGEITDEQARAIARCNLAHLPGVKCRGCGATMRDEASLYDVTVRFSFSDAIREAGL